ncbi:MAG TPA: hypothetical protein VHP36_03090 [Chitinispirillaceae bacterium]|nr:hypothetical protein [Chitinispirillaceae bacterium]
MFKNIIVLIITVIFLQQCSENNISANNGGGASETIATVKSSYDSIVVEVSSEKEFSVEAVVCINNYSIVDSLGFHKKRIMSGKSDKWIISQLETGSYNIILHDMNKNNAVIFQNVSTGSLKNGNYSEMKIIGQTGSVSGFLLEKSSGDNYQPITNGIVFINGTQLSATTENDGSYQINNVPEGNYTVGARKASQKINSQNVYNFVKVSGDSISATNIIFTQP